MAKKRRKRRRTTQVKEPGILDVLLWGEKPNRKRRKSKKQKQKEQWNFEVAENVAREVWAVIFLSTGILITLSLSDQLGLIGKWMNTFLKPIFGYGLYGLPPIFFGISVLLFLSKSLKITLAKLTGIGLFIISLLSIIHLSVPADQILDFAKNGTYGGYMGFITNFLLRDLLKVGNLGSSILFITTFLISLLLTFEVSIKEGMNMLFGLENKETEKTKTKKAAIEKEPKQTTLKQIPDEATGINIIKPEAINKDDAKEVQTKDESQTELFTEEVEIINHKDDKETEEESTLEKVIDWEFPSVELLDKESGKITSNDKFLIESAEKIKNKLDQFDISVKMGDVHVGPTVIQYTLKPHEGVKLSKITSLKNDLALALAAKSIRIEAPIPGKALVGIEVPSEDRTVVRLKEMLKAPSFAKMVSENKLAFPLGRNVSGAPLFAELNEMPHLLVAGATGAGKSVAINSFLISLLYNNAPADLKLILIDPKQVELRDYNGIPHLLTPVITDPEKAANSLKWAVAEMTRRYNTLSEAGCRNIDEYNKEEGRLKKMPKIVILIDELADLMMACGKEVESAICRIAQMARAVGIHLIIATQRPSVDVITGLIKANIPTRISFAVTSQIDSRTILDASGAEDLLGKGDMLYLKKDLSKPIRVQGIYISPKEIKKVTNKLKLTLEPDYKEEITQKPSKANNKAGGGSGSDEDELYDDAVEVIIQNKKASASLLQRKLKIGYARAARLLDILEENGVVGPVNGAKPREIYLEAVKPAEPEVEVAD
jgi:S-DNA-T family DNA segregation ATPase FtsK/SpoIIIE